jgi:lysylphosphatidylglycerol synthetase-like protein (DUF2156 family)
MPQQQKTTAKRHGQPLPRVRTASAYWLSGSALVLALSIAGLPLALALDTTSGVSALLIVLEIVSLLCLIVAALAQRKAKQAIPRMLADARTVHWRYTPAEWQRFSSQAWRRSIRSMLKVTGITWGILLVVALLLSAQANSTVTFSSALTLSTGVAALVGALLLARAVALLLWRRRQTTLDVYLHPAGFILGGWYTPLNWIVGGRKKITYTPGDPGVLSFDVGTGRGARVLEVPVPQGREEEARQLAGRL